MEDILQLLLEKRDELQNRTVKACEWAEGMGLLYAFDEDRNMIAVGENWAYRSEEGLLMSEYFVDGSPRESSSGEKQIIEMLYLLPGDLKPEEEDRIAEAVSEALPLPPAYGVGQIICREHVFTISSKAGNPSFCGAYEVIKHEFRSVPYSYHTRGLTASVLELYYYEVLAESHQLYLEEETFKREMKERKKRSKDLKKKQVREEDFHKDTDGTYTCEQRIKLWGVTTTLYATLQENPEDQKGILKKYVDSLNDHILWVEKHKKDIEQKLLDSDMVKWANHWIEGHDSFDEDCQTYYELDDGEVVPYPVTEKAFLENLYIQSITIYSAAPDTARIRFFLDTAPSFFGDHSIQLVIDAKKDIQESTRTKWKYDIHKAGLAG